MPAGTAALVLQSRPGQELTCQAKNFAFKCDGEIRDEGVVTHYATRALEKADTVEDWLERTLAYARADAERGKLPLAVQLSLTTAGTARLSLPGSPAK